MKDILAAPQREVLTQFAWSNVLVGLDFDGTLAPIVQRPDDAKLRARTRALLVSLAAEYPVAVVSGRGRDDVGQRLEGIAIDAVVGNHGLEPGADLGRCKSLVAEWVPRVRRALENEAGVEVEDKTFSLAVHYRRSRTRRTALQRIRSAIADLGSATRVIGGKLVVNVLPADAPHKGVALVRLRAQAGTDTALYVGDDVTDEDVFALDDPGRLLCIRVGHNGKSRARYYVSSQRSVDELLRTLVAIRRAMPRRTSRRGALVTDFEGQPDERPSLGAVVETLQRVWALNHEIERLSARMQRAIGITAQQRMVLRIVGRFPGITPGRLSTLLCIDAATLSTTLARLERRGLLERQRDERDGRRLSVALTARGRELDVPTRGTVEAAVEIALGKCDPSDVASAYRVLDVLTQSVIEQEASAPPVESAASRPRARNATPTRRR